MGESNMLSKASRLLENNQVKEIFPEQGRTFNIKGDTGEHIVNIKASCDCHSFKYRGVCSHILTAALKMAEAKGGD